MAPLKRRHVFAIWWLIVIRGRKKKQYGLHIDNELQGMLIVDEYSVCFMEETQMTKLDLGFGL